MGSFNKIIIVGYLGRDPELRYMPDGTAVCNFSVATTEKRKDVTGEPRELTTWFRVNIWGRQAELADNWLKQGKRVYVEGRLSLQTYTDREGNPKTSCEVRASDLQFLERGEKDGDESKPAEKPKKKKEIVPIDEDEIPF